MRPTLCKFVSALLGGALTLPLPLQAQEFPTRPVKFIAPTGPGNATDLMLRNIATKLAEKTGWNTLVENRPGGRFHSGHARDHAIARGWLLDPAHGLLLDHSAGHAKEPAL